MEEAQTGTKKTSGQANGRSVAALGGTTRPDKHRSGSSSHSHGRPSSQLPPRNKINTASRTSGIADPYDMSTEDEVLNLGLESERRTSRREERAIVADPEMTFRPENYEISATCPPFLRGKRGLILLTVTLLVVVGVLVGAILGTKQASKPKPSAVASNTTQASLLQPTAEISTEIHTETLVIHDTVTEAPAPTTQ